MIKSNRGQLSVFMGITLILVMGMLAFIVNVGLFVKAKINLQNAVDAAAYAGAATQARQLTNIAYVNWEMRNTYKEWMFKYYILGQLGLVKGNNNLSDAILSGSDTASFLLRTPSVAGNAASVGFDKFNLPSICVHNNSSTDICPIYALPGIPRFPALGVAGISEIHESLVNKLVEEKGENCSARTQINFLAALSWAYSSGIKEIAGAPLIATNRAGAWPEALELAMRMRNLEMIVNRPPVAEINYMNMASLVNVGQEIGLNERPIKAFMSAFRNLGGGKYKDKLDGSAGGSAGNAVDELAATFKLTEIAPRPFQAPELSVSGFLIPSSFTYPGETSMTALTKHYLDLQAMPINYATMFTTFATTRNEFEPTVDSEASCFVSKSAMPVPGYIMGFVKNPTVLTYYAVKGEAEFTGLFFPRLSNDQDATFKLTAYAAAKPFGGRIGPRLFRFEDSERSVMPRNDDNSRSSSYISGIRIDAANDSFVPGMPIPPSQDFWSNDATVIGGVPGTNASISYGIPNLIYDFNSSSELEAQNSAGVSKIQDVRAQEFAGASTDEKRGLYSSYQIRELKKALGGDFTGKVMTSDDLMRALVTARKVTKYDAVNYLIPDFKNPSSGEKTNAASTVQQLPQAVPGGVGIYYKLFAPLVGNELLYKNNAEVGSIVVTYMKANDKAIDVYLAALLEVGQSIFNLPSGQGSSTNVNAQAAQSIHANAANGAGASPLPPDITSADPMDEKTCTKHDMASKFNHFFRKSQTQCGIVPLESLMIDYIDKKNQGNGKLFYVSTYFNPSGSRGIMTAYYPGPRQGATPDRDATALNPIGAPGTADYSTRRNFYSTKFVPLSKLFASSSDYKHAVYRESAERVPADLDNLTLQNPIQADNTTGLDKPYFLDF